MPVPVDRVSFFLAEDLGESLIYKLNQLIRTHVTNRQCDVLLFAYWTFLPSKANPSMP